MEIPEVVDVSPEEAQRLSLECLQQFDGNAQFYTTVRAVEDLDALRQAAGYPQFTIYGVSYGTRMALEYLRAYPDKVRALVLDGVVAPTVNLAGNEIARRSQQAFDRLVSRCENDPSCLAAHGNLRETFEVVRAQLIKATVNVQFMHPVSGAVVQREVTEADLLGAVRLMPYTTESLALLPLLLTQAKQGQFAMLAAQAIMLEEQLAKHYAVGMNNSIICTEDYPFLTDVERQPPKDTYFAGTMIDMIKAMCEVWPRGDDYMQSRELFSSDVPVLVMSGEYDPITPPSNGDIVANMLSNAQHVVVPAQGHGVFDRGCMAQITTNFVEQAHFNNFDASCVERQIPFPLFIDAAGPKQ
jgi:pimeloyl-ACP methyl ester carboxylesterase